MVTEVDKDYNYDGARVTMTLMSKPLAAGKPGFFYHVLRRSKSQEIANKSAYTEFKNAIDKLANQCTDAIREY